MSESAELSQKEQTLSPEALAFVRSAGTATDLPAFVRNVRAISSVASDLDVRVALLEQAITKDVALTGKVLRIASSAMTGSSQRVSSVKQAIMMLGYHRLQHLSTSTSVFDQIEKSAPAVASNGQHRNRVKRRWPRSRWPSWSLQPNRARQTPPMKRMFATRCGRSRRSVSRAKR